MAQLQRSRAQSGLLTIMERVPAIHAAAPTPAEPHPPSDRRSSDAPRMVVHAHGIALVVLAVVAAMFALHWAQKFFIPLVLGVLIAYTLNPLVVGLQRIRIPRVFAATLVTAALIGATTLIANLVSGEVAAIIENLPDASNKVSIALTRMNPPGKATAIQKVQQAATQLEKATSQAAGGALTPRPSAPPVAVVPPAFSVRDFLLARSAAAAQFVGQTVMVLFLVYFLLLSGDTFKRKFVRLAGPSLSQKKITLKILDDINVSVQGYMLMLLVTNALLGVLAWGGFRLVGLENAGAWAVAAGLLPLVPYIGAAVIAVATGVAGFLQTDSLAMAMQAAGIVLGLSLVVGILMTTWMAGKVSKTNASAVFIALLFWGWPWGVSGLLLVVPIMAVVRVVSQNVEVLKPLGELLSE